jgi:hypothetical protein
MRTVTIKENSKEIAETAKVFSFLKVAPNIKVIGVTIKGMALV